MEGSTGRGRRRWRCVKERLGFMGCCGSPMVVSRHPSDDDDEQGAEAAYYRQQHEEGEGVSNPGESGPLGCLLDRSPEGGRTGEEMNLAAALAAERQYRAATPAEVEVEGTPLRVSLLRLLEQGEEKVGRDGDDEGSSGACCVCMGRPKGAAFIPCGHTFCRVCARELWLNRGSCPLCNRPVLEILDIF